MSFHFNLRRHLKLAAALFDSLGRTTRQGRGIVRDNRASLITASVTAAVSVWTIVASLVFSESTVQNLALASALAVGGLAITGLTTHELSVERAVQSLEDDTGERQSRLAAAA